MLSRHAVALAGVDGEVRRAPDAPFASLAEALAAFGALPVTPPGRFAGRNVEVSVDDAWVRVFGARWPESIADAALFRGFVAARFEQRFDLPSAAWTFAMPGAWPGRTVLCVAAPNELVAGVRAACGRHGLKPGRLSSLTLTEIDAAIPVLPRTATVAVTSRAPLRQVYLLSGGRIVDCVVLPDSGAIDGLAADVFRDRGLLPGDARRSIFVESDRIEAIKRLLAGERLPLREGRVADGSGAAVSLGAGGGR